MNNKKITFTQQKYYSPNPLRRFFIKRFLQNILQEIKDKKVINLLDVGCGEGQADSFFLKNQSNLKITGVDVNELSLKEAKKNCPKMKVQKADIYRLPFPDQSFDLILCLEVLEHLEEPEKAVKEIKRVGKKFIISIPWEPYFSLMSFFSGRYLKNLGRHPEHLQFWGRKSFAEFIKKELPKAKIKTSFPWLIAEGEL